MTQTELETVKLKQLASAYRSKGYAVSVQPGPEELPEFLAPFHPDLVATSPQDNVVVEIRSAATVVADPLVKVAEAVEAHPGWRLELAIVNLPAAHEVPVDGKLVPDDRIDSLLQEAQSLTREKRYEAATIVAWAAAEATFRQLVRSHGVAPERKASSTVLKQLYIFGEIDPDEYHRFTRAMEFRNAFAHGFLASATPEVVEQLIHDVEELRSRRAA